MKDGLPAGRQGARAAPRTTSCSGCAASSGRRRSATAARSIPTATGLLLADPRPGDPAHPLPDPRPQGLRGHDPLRHRRPTPTTPSGRVTAEAPAEALAALTARWRPMRRFDGTFEQQAAPLLGEEGRRASSSTSWRGAARRCPRSARRSPSTSSRRGARPAPTSTSRTAVAFRLACSSGTYARTLAHDLGRALGVGAHLSALCGGRRSGRSRSARRSPWRRSRSGSSGGRRDRRRLRRLRPDPAPLRRGDVADPQQEQRISHGQTVLVRGARGRGRGLGEAGQPAPRASSPSAPSSSASARGGRDRPAPRSCSSGPDMVRCSRIVD